MIVAFLYIQQTFQHFYWLHLVNVGTIQSLKSAVGVSRWIKIIRSSDK